ncbi:EamA family transporter [Pseudomonas sp. DC3000-4b1]|uniref:EamA family transporter n=1 Tax=unclassified Pseudomonas TaxID=196821 RepID=UPI003CE84188
MKLSNKDLLAGLLVTMIWGCNFSIIELGLRALDPFLLTLLRFTFCAVPAILFIKKPAGISCTVLLLYGTLFGSGLWWTVNFAMHKGLSAGMSSIFLQFSAFFTIIASALIFKEKISAIHFAGMAISLMGLLLMLGASEASSTLAGISLVLAAALAWAFCNLIVKRTKPLDMVAFIVWSSLFSLPSLLTLTLLVKGTEPFESLPAKITWEATFSIAFQSFVTTLFGYHVWNSLMKKYPAALVAPLSLVVPITGVLCSVAFFDETLDAQQQLALALVLIGLSIFMLAPRLVGKICRHRCTS